MLRVAVTNLGRELGGPCERDLADRGASCQEARQGDQARFAGARKPGRSILRFQGSG
jgi:hypothetical protein